MPKEINAFTKRSAAALAGQGLMGVARDTYPHDGNSLSFVASFAEVEVDVETGEYHIVDFLAVADVGTVIHPAALGGQILGRSMLGISHAIGQKWVYDQHYGVALAKRFHYNKPPTILDAPTHMAWAAVELPDPETPVGARGIGEPPVAAGCAAVLNAISAALGDEVFRRAPVNLDGILDGAGGGKTDDGPAHRQRVSSDSGSRFRVSVRRNLERRVSNLRQRGAKVSDSILLQGGVHRDKGEGKSFWLLTDLHTFKLVGDETRGSLVVAELNADFELGPPPHVHHNADESFYILEGTFDFSLAGKAFSAGPGAFVYLPKGVVHTHKAGAGARARALVMQSPAGVERFIAEAGTPATDLSHPPAAPEMSEFAKIVAIAQKHGIEVPPLASARWRMPIKFALCSTVRRTKTQRQSHKRRPLSNEELK